MSINVIHTKRRFAWVLISSHLSPLGDHCLYPAQGITLVWTHTTKLALRVSEYLRLPMMASKFLRISQWGRHTKHTSSLINWIQRLR